MDRQQDELCANPGYAGWQIARALRTAADHTDPEVRQQAERKIKRWNSVLTGMLNGTLKIGSRTPLANTPAWATLDVATGGFATGGMLAGGPLLKHETDRLHTLGDDAEQAGRLALNRYFITDSGLAELSEWLRTGNYTISVPEEGALLVVAWLVENGHVDAARSLLKTIAPCFSTLRFYPTPRSQPLRGGNKVYLQTVGDTVQALHRILPNGLILSQREAITKWAVLYDAVVSLFLQTVEGSVPTLEKDDAGCNLPIVNGRFPVIGGWPCQTYPDGWKAHAQEVLNLYKSARERHRLSGRPEDMGDSFAQLRHYLQQCIDDPSELSGRDVGRIRLIIARYVAKRGTPGSEEWRAARAKQKLQADPAPHKDIAGVVARRLGFQEQNSGLDDVGPLLLPITEAEANEFGLPAGTTLPPGIEHKTKRCLRDTVEVLAERGIITSSESMARVLPQFTSEVNASGFADPALRALYAASYRAFRNRRSLLLLNLESQVKLGELPWIRAFESFRDSSKATQESARQAVREISLVAMRVFPCMIIPNKLIQELGALIKMAELEIPLVEELAVDIFMGEFSPKYLKAAKQSAHMLEGTLYQRYYEIDYSAILSMPEEKKKTKRRYNTPPSPFATYCSSRAGATIGSWLPATNGMIVEQEQILTTHNLAPMVEGLHLLPELEGRLLDLSQTCFRWICRLQQVKSVSRHARLIIAKNTAYAWRQMVFFLAQLPESEQRGFLQWGEEHLAEQRQSYQATFRPVMTGLSMAIHGQTLTDETLSSNGARRFLGWSNQTHWLLE